MTKPNVVFTPADANNYASRLGGTISGIVIHATQGWRSGVVQKFQDQTSKTSCHYLVCMDGTIVQFVADIYAAYHAGNADVNRHTIGIEIEALIEVIGQPGQYLNPPKGFTEPQYNALLDLCRWLGSAYTIKPQRMGRSPFESVGIIAHADIPDPLRPGMFGGASHHTDPGPYFPWWDRLLSDLQSASV